MLPRKMSKGTRSLGTAKKPPKSSFLANLEDEDLPYCHKRQPLTEYHRARANRDGLFRRCKACCAAIRRLRYLKNREQVLDQQREYYSARREEILAAHKEYSKANPEYAREYYRRNREKLLEYGRKYRQRKKAGIT